jgi:undecaprenyl diphosphate synthase
LDYKDLLIKLDQDHLPRHVAIIMDGNGRWAKKHRRNRLFGHHQGAKALHQVVEAAVEINMEYMTVYAFSTENWNRPADEVKGLLKLLRETLLKEIDDLYKNNVVVRFIGCRSQLGNEFWGKLDDTCKRTWNNTGLKLNVAFNYGGRQEILDVVNQIITEIQLGKEIVVPITEKTINSYLYTDNMPDPDLIIRTSGEQRLSNFLIWQTAYSEFYFTETLWPDFGKVEFIEALLEYQKRNRRYGAL